MPKILLVDDMVFFRKMYCDTLHNAGYDIVEASDGLEGIEKAQEAQPDLILLDLEMPRLGGLCALGRLKCNDLTSHIKVIVLSSKDAQEDIQEALRQGADDYLIKTANRPLEVIEKIRKILKDAESTAASRPAPTAAATSGPKTFRVFLRQGERSADSLATACSLSRGFSCPRCQEELVLELTEDTGLSANNTLKHMFKARLVCPRCEGEF